jgi:hypothetical protein
MMTTDMRKSLPANIEEMFKMNYTVITHEPILGPILISYLKSNQYVKINFTNLLKLILFNFRENIKLVSEDEYFDYFEQNQMLNATAKLSFFELDSNFILYGSIFEFTPNRLPENLLSSPMGFAFVPNNFLFPLFDEVIQRFNSAGILQWTIQLYNKRFYKPYQEPLREPQVFSIEDLSFGFFIWLAALGVSSMVFASELLPKFVRWIAKKIRIALSLILFVSYWKRLRNKIKH